MNMKKCTQCLVFKNIEAFSYRNKNKGQYSPICKNCKSLYLKNHYEKSDSRKEKIKQNNQIVIASNIGKIDEYLKLHPCVDCGETDPIVLEFDHVRGDKRFAISARKFSAAKWETIEKEIEKCDVRCANCHRRKTFLERRLNNEKE